MQPSHQDLESAGKHVQQSTAAELWEFLSQNKKWWLLPIVAVLGLFGAMLLLSGTAAAPFIYTLF